MNDPEADPHAGTQAKRMGEGAARAPICTGTLVGPCDRPAVAAVHVHYGMDRGRLPTILIRPDHLAQPDLAADGWRCLDCLHHDIDAELVGERL